MTCAFWIFEWAWGWKGFASTVMTIIFPPHVFWTTIVTSYLGFTKDRVEAAKDSSREDQSALFSLDFQLSKEPQLSCHLFSSIPNSNTDIAPGKILHHPPKRNILS